VTEDVHTGDRRDVTRVQGDDPESADGPSRRGCPECHPRNPGCY